LVGGFWWVLRERVGELRQKERGVVATPRRRSRGGERKKAKPLLLLSCSASCDADADRREDPSRCGDRDGGRLSRRRGARRARAITASEGGRDWERREGEGREREKRLKVSPRSLPSRSAHAVDSQGADALADPKRTGAAAAARPASVAAPARAMRGATGARFTATARDDVVALIVFMIVEWMCCV
jgi:hypothetical protein